MSIAQYATPCQPTCGSDRMADLFNPCLIA